MGATTPTVAVTEARVRVPSGWPTRAGRRAGRWLQELGWLLAIVLGLPVAVLAIGSAIALVVNLVIVVVDLVTK